MTWVTGQKLQNGKYIIQQVLGQGGFGITYQALQVNLNRSVVIKTPNEYLQHDPDYEKYIEKFIAEGQILAELSKDPHPHIVGVIELFQEGNTYCLVMEFIPGENLFQIVKRKGALPEAEIITYIRQIGAALIMIHQAGLVHRDAHPGNIMIKDNGKAVLIDFGIAKQIIPATQSSTDKSAHERFAPYEQRYKGSRDPRVDIYCLAASLYYGVTGQYPTNSLARKLDDELLIAPHKIIVTISKELNQAILKGMALEAKDRPQSMQSWIEMLNYKHKIPNTVAKGGDAGKKIVNVVVKGRNAGIEIVNAVANIVNAGTKIVNVVVKGRNVEAKDPTVTPPPPVEDTYRKEYVYSRPTVEEETIRNKPARTIPWVSLTILLLTYWLIGFILTVVNPPFWLWAVVVVATVAVAWDVGRAVAWDVARVVATAWVVEPILAGASVSAAIPAAISAWVVGGVAAGAVSWAGAELETSFSKFHTFLSLAGTSNVGLGLGWIVHRLFKLVG
ncbi:serine/threonine-protein kinase [Anabaena sp. AL93]|uniref:serine/threonine protein kinase n=1 Tax=Anabaena sp. AL93 TaxID=1678133 RepID=UPI000801C342|nr:serine/threonine-protein kinase [Anabaena sp. AL93]OBQ21114.1 MAG: serine/threonine protein kinase [Anabaena sp. AL93]